MVIADDGFSESNEDVTVLNPTGSTCLVLGQRRKFNLGSLDLTARTEQE